jgi:hypothetical protein
MKFGRLTLIISILGLGLLQGLPASQTLGYEPNTAAPAIEPLAGGQKTPAQAPAPAEPNGPPPKITFDQTIHDFGLVAPGSVQTCEFNFKNAGPGKLIISDVSKTCGCTVFTLEKKEYAPGEKGTLKVQFSADKGAGSRTRHLYVFSNDPVNQKVELTIKASIAQKVVFEPDRLEYKLKGDKAGQAELTIRSLDGQTFAITKFEATNGAVTADFDPAVKAQAVLNTGGSKDNPGVQAADACQIPAQIVLHTKLDPQKMGASSNGRIEIAVTHPECTSITVPFSVLARFRLDPPAINILNAQPEEIFQRELWVLDNYDEDFEIASATSTQNIIKVVSQEKLGNRYKLNLEITCPASKGTARMFTDTLTLTMKDGEKINVTCRGFFKRQ